MSHLFQMRLGRTIARLLILYLVGGLFLPALQPATAVVNGGGNGGGIIISAVKISGGSGHTSDEYIELYNQSSEPVDISGWKLAKLTKNSSSTAYIELGLPILEGTLVPAHGYWLAAHTQSQELTAAEVDWQYQTSALSDDNSVVVLGKNGTVIDLLGWGAAGNFLGAAALAPGTSALQRQIDGEGKWLVTNNNSVDFAKSSPAPHRRLSAGIDDSVAAMVTTSTSAEATTTTEMSVSDISETAATSTEFEIASSTVETSVVEMSAPHILITELLPKPAVGQTEFVELFNAGDRVVSLDDWKLVDASGAGTMVSGTIEVGAYVVIWSPKGSLNNAGDSIILVNEKEEVADRVTYGEEAGGVLIPEVGNSLIRLYVDEEWGVWEQTSVSTPGEPNIREFLEDSAEVTVSNQSNQSNQSSAGVNSGKTVNTKTIKISEFFPDPVGDDSVGEFIELVNRGSETVDLNKWRLQVNGQEYVFENQALAAGAWLVLSRATTGLVLPNKDNVTVRLYNAVGVEQDHTSYREVIEGAARVFVEGWAWQWTRRPTAGLSNEWVRPNRPPHAEITGPSIAEIGELVAWASDNTYDPDRDALVYAWDLGDGQIGTGAAVQTVYEKTGKYKVRLSARDLFGEEDSVEQTIVIKTRPVVFAATGVMSTPKSAILKKTSATAEISEVAAKKIKNKATTKKKVEKKTIIKKAVDNRMVDLGPAVTTTASRLAELSGKIIQLSGEITSGKSRNWRIDDGTDEISVVLPTGKSPLGTTWRVGNRWHIKGVVQKSKDEWAITVRSWADVTLIKNPEETEGFEESIIGAVGASVRSSDGFSWWNLLVIFGLGAAVVIWQRVKRTRRAANNLGTIISQTSI